MQIVYDSLVYLHISITVTILILYKYDPGEIFLSASKNPTAYFCSAVL